MAKKKTSKKRSAGGDIFNYPIALVVIGILAIIFGLFFALSEEFSNRPIPRSEAISYSGEFDKYDIGRNYSGIYFSDGSYYNLFPHTQTTDFKNAMESLKKGTMLYILVNPNSDYVAEIKTDTQELLNFEASQEAIAKYDNGYVGIGIFVCFCGVFLIVFAILSLKHEKKEVKRVKNKEKNRVAGQDDKAMRYAKNSVKCKILLEATADKYEICYRRVKNVNELIVNGRVYDEYKATIEFKHNLSAIIENHKIEAGLDSNSCSYIMFDGEIIATKKRNI